MLVNQTSKVNKENQNPVLIINQQEQLKQNGILPKNHFNQRIPERYQSTVSCYQQGMTKCTSSRSLQEQIERIAKKLKSKQDKENVRQLTILNKYSIDEMVDLLQNDKLLHIRSLQLQLNSSKNKQKSPKNIFPPLQLKQNFQSFETTKSSENETINHKIENRYRFYSKPNTISIQKTEGRDSLRAADQRKKRTVSQVIDMPEPLTKKERIEKALQNTQRIIQLCGPLKNDTITNEELECLIKKEQFKLELECLIQQSTNSQDSKSQLQSFMLQQIKKYAELRDAEQDHQKKKENLDQIIDDYLKELKNKL